ncbi:MAG: hypothetical protein HY425_02330 [Candidatus Levybacteria bacterium]|nr:hypothetical protein [Candidatus Levybacteria bacterium]
MYKKFLSLLLIVNCYLLIVAPLALAATPTQDDRTQEIRDQLITNIASRVAQLKLVEKRGIIGIVINVTNTQITVTDLQNNTRFIDVDELTKFSSPNARGTYGISDIKKDSAIGVLGLYNKESRRILARFVNAITVPLIVHGGVAAIDNENFAITIATEKGKEIIADIEALTRTYLYTQEEGYGRSGFSKIKENYSIIAVGVKDIKDNQRMTATRIIFFPEIPARLPK